MELDGSNNITARYTHGPGIDEPLVMEKSGQSFFYHADGLGSITEITNASGSVVQRYTYSSFGKIEFQLGPNFIQPYTFTAREYDHETDTYFYRNRTYDWRTGRFTTEDPIGFDGGDNFYVYEGRKRDRLVFSHLYGFSFGSLNWLHQPRQSQPGHFLAQRRKP